MRLMGRLESLRASGERLCRGEGPKSWDIGWVRTVQGASRVTEETSERHWERGQAGGGEEGVVLWGRAQNQKPPK